MFDPKRAVSDPTYYTEGASIDQWSESFEFAIFDAGNPFARHVLPTRIDDNGKLDGQRASVYGKLFIPLPSHNSPKQEASLFIFYPKAYFEASRAYVKVFEEDDEEIYKAYGHDADDYAYFANDLRLEIPVFISRSPDGLKMTSEQIGAFISELTNEKK